MNILISRLVHITKHGSLNYGSNAGKLQLFLGSSVPMFVFKIQNIFKECVSQGCVGSSTMFMDLWMQRGKYMSVREGGETLMIFSTILSICCRVLQSEAMHFQPDSDAAPLFLRDMAEHQYWMVSIEQGFPNSVLEGRCPASLRSFPASVHLIQMNGSLTDLCRSGWRADGDPFIRMRCVVSGKHLRPAGQQPSRTEFGHPCHRDSVPKCLNVAWVGIFQASLFIEKIIYCDFILWV